MKKRADKAKVINRRQLLKDALGGAAAVGGASLLSPIVAIGQTPDLKPIHADNDDDHLQVEVDLSRGDVAVELDGKPIAFDGGRVKATYMRVPQLRPTIQVIDVSGKVRQTVPPQQLIYARSPFLFACCCCCCCHTANIKLK